MIIIEDVMMLRFVKSHWICKEAITREMEGSPADFLTNQAILKQKVHCHTSMATPVGIEPVTPQLQAVALPTTP
jgi:hypothetical protein